MKQPSHNANRGRGYTLIAGVRQKNGPMPTISVQPSACQPIVSTISNPTIHQAIFDLKEAVKWDPKQRRWNGLVQDTEPSQVRQRYIEAALEELAKVRRKIGAAYSDAGIDGSACFSQALCHFVDDLIISGGPLKEKLAPITIDAYFGAVTKLQSDLGASWICACFPP